MNQLVKLRRPLFFQCCASSAISSRQQSTERKPKCAYGPLEVRRTSLLNGIRVAAAKELGAVIASCTIMFQAGSRFESDSQLGATHFIRACSSASGCGYSSLLKMRLPQQHGAAVTCTTDRQSVAFTLRCPPPTFNALRHFLHDMAARCCFHHWEIDDRRQLLHDDLVRIHPRDRVMDLVQSASWTGGLANSVYCAEERIDAMESDDLNCFTFTHFRMDETSVASVGVPFEETIKLAEMLEFRRGERPQARVVDAAMSRAGFEYHDLGPGADTWVALAVPGCGSCNDLGCLLKHAIIAEACGTGDIEKGSHSLDRTPAPPLGTMAGHDVYTQYRAFNISHRETGIFVRTRACTAWQATLAASEFLAHVGDLNYKQIEIGRARLKLQLAMHEEDCVKTSEGLALQLANCVRFDNACVAMYLIDSIPLEEICAVAKNLSSKSSLMSMAVVGDVGAVPHDMELMCCR